MNTNVNTRGIDYIAVDKQSAISSNGQEFLIGEVVTHDETEAGEATITSFEIDEVTNEVKVWTSKGYAHLDFLRKTETSVQQ